MARRKRSSAEMARLGAMGGKATVKAHGLEHYAAAGRRGGNKVKKTRGVAWFSVLGKRGGKRLQQLAAAGRKAEAAEARQRRKSA